MRHHRIKLPVGILLSVQLFLLMLELGVMPDVLVELYLLALDFFLPFFRSSVLPF